MSINAWFAVAGFVGLFLVFAPTTMWWLLGPTPSFTDEQSCRNHYRQRGMFALLIAIAAMICLTIARPPETVGAVGEFIIVAIMLVGAVAGLFELRWRTELKLRTDSAD